MILSRFAGGTLLSLVRNTGTCTSVSTLIVLNAAKYGTVSIANSLNQTLSIFDVRRRSPFFAELAGRTYTSYYGGVPPTTEGIGIAKRVDEEEPRWFHPSPTERMENPAYTYLKNHPEYQQMFFQHEVYSRLMTKDGRLTPEGEDTINPAVKGLIDLCNTKPDEVITHPNYASVFKGVISQSSTLTDIELLLYFFTLRRFPNRPRARDKDYKKIWQPLDDLCLQRSSQNIWTLEYKFNLADLIYSADLVRESRFHWDLVKRLYRRVDHLSKEEFIRMMFCFGGVKSLPDSLSIYNVEYNLPKFIDELTSEEIAVISVGFLRTKTSVSNKKVLRRMLQIVENDAPRIPPPSVSAVAKAIIISSLNHVVPDVHKFLDAFVPEIERLDVHACASLVLLSLRARIEHIILYKTIVKKLEGKVSTIRIKDLDYILSGLSTFNIKSDAFYQEIITDMHQRIMNMPMKVFCATHGRSFINILHYLSMQNIYPQDMISLALSEEFLRRTFGQSMYLYTQEVLYLDICTGLESKGYSGPRLHDKFRGFLTKKNMLWIADDEKAASSDFQSVARFTFEICADTLGGPEYCHLCNVVPPFRTIGVVYCLDERKEPVPLPESLLAIDEFMIKYLPQIDSAKYGHLTFHVITIFPGTQSAANSGNPTGMAVMHCRQMKKLGYHVHPIYMEFTVSNPEEIKDRVSSALEASLVP